MPNSYVRYLTFKGARFIALGADANSVAYFDFDDEAGAIAEGEDWIAAEGPAHPWYVVYGQQQDGRLVRIAGENT